MNHIFLFFSSSWLTITCMGWVFCMHRLSSSAIQCQMLSPEGRVLTMDNRDWVQAESSGNACLGSPVWISSTIPDGWAWHFSTQPDASSDQNIHLVRRQSTCELEGDTTVDEILNQQFKMYSSLSQTCSDVKMVQSLIPIWEEYEGSGIHEAAIHYDPGKPHPQDVLKTFSHGLEFVNKLTELCSEAENSSSCNPFEKDASPVPSIRSSTDGGNMFGLGIVHSKSDCGEPSKGFKVSSGTASMLSQRLACEEISDEGGNFCLEQILVPDMQTSEEIRSSNLKIADKEGLGLLRWLASSQAADDINSDDELVCEPILSPLLPAATIDKVLEKANLDYESESQQECQDILDSIEDSTNLEVLNKKASCSTDPSYAYQTSPMKTIAQLDGFSNDQNPVTNVGRSPKLEINIELGRLSQDLVQKETSSSFVNKHKRKKPLWGSLPFSLTKKRNDDIQPVCTNMSDRSGSETKDGSITSCQAEADKCCDDSVSNADRNPDSNDASALVGCSVRDLMRRKRCYRIETPESKSRRVEKTSSEEEQKEVPFSLKKRLEFPTPWNDGQDKRPLECAYSCPSLAGELIKFNEWNPRVTTSSLEGCGEACDVKAAYSSYSAHDKLPLSSSNPGSSWVNTSRDGCVDSCGVDDEAGIQRKAGSGNFIITGLPPLNTGTKELPQFLNTDCRNSLASLGHCENDSHTQSDSLVNCIEPVTSDVYISNPNPFVSMLKFNTDDNLLASERLLQRDTTTTRCLSKSVESEVLVRDDYVCKNAYERRTSTHRIDEMSPEYFEGMEAVTIATFLQFENCGGEQHGGATGLSCSDMEAKPGDLVGMTFYKKPPKIDLADGTSENASMPSTLPNRASLPGMENNEGLSVRGKVTDELLPFFWGDSLEEKEIQGNSCTDNDSDHHQETVVGVPTHCQNDGSYLYILTSALSPPSVESVRRWLMQYDAGSSGSQYSSQGSPADTCKKCPPQSSSVSDVKSIPNQLNQQTHGNSNAQGKPSHNGVTAKCDGNIMDVKEHTDHSQDLSQISGPDGKSKSTPLSQIGFRDPASIGGGQQLTLLSIEIQVETRGDLLPDPLFDAINIIVLATQEDSDNIHDVYVLMRSKNEYIQRNLDGISGCEVLVSSEEKHLLNQFIDIISTFDPDILIGWDIQGGSLGFLAERASHLGISLLNSISRTPSDMKVAALDLDVPVRGISDILRPEPLISDTVQVENAVIEDEWGRTHASGVHVGGRIVLNVWRVMRGEIKLNMYTVEAVAEDVLRRKIPSIHCKVLTKWFSSGPGRARYRCIEYVVERAKLNLEIMNQLDMISRTSELARVFGIDFFSVLSRGSQYRVESMLLRLAHSQNYLAISPGNLQVASQPAMECLPLVMEPESGFYADPVVVLDFQSLYPSMIIAYNLCFCTCLGNVTPSKANTLGVSSFSLDARVLRDLKNEILLTPNGVMYVTSKVRKGILPRLLEEILSTRIMVKKGMKELAPSQQVLYRIFNARQLALKLISNVTYGYTAAGFSGRMPCAELADSIVQCGRRTLESAISFVNAHDKWKAKVIYGDTDSMFVLLKGRTVKESFQIGHEIASTITAMNPHPVTLKMEKVYHPCFLLTKKRYVGYSFESPNQIKPTFDAKGIETVRRDTCGAVAKTMEQSLRLFFEHQDNNKIKAYLQRQWTRILSGRVSLQDFVFAKEVRLGTYSTRASSSLPPAAIVATKAMRADRRAEPRYAERIPYVVVHGEPGSRLVDMVVDPLDLLAIDAPFRLNDLYYINKQIIPALQRVFGLVGADLNQWFSDMPRPGREAITKFNSYAPNSHRTRIDYYYLSKHCILCGELVQASAHICGKCLKNEAAVATALTGRTSKLERETQHLVAMCRHCGGGDGLMESGIKCTSLACSVFYERRKVQKELQALSTVATEAGLYPRCMVEWF
ncbi:DNA polymerase zeta catalytic subunit isoform X2 [Cornus florida]|uniref:DNA polymerase zeta catalytic subunit isoform X2 n=1 Tax=Cornus florida TaxID=4283 RepID=UPI0028A1B440|nr:DNA polymerase zeta catalytic subunit isoform X2 [Cornus florida]